MDKLSFKILKLYSKRTELSLSQLSAVTNMEGEIVNGPAAALKEAGYLQADAAAAFSGEKEALNGEIPLTITEAGKKALSAEKKSRAYFAWNETRAWITLALAVAAFVLSIVK